ncbi:MAG: sigma-E factor negative regulatory protein [Pseudomonadota bacterium]
MNHQEHSSQLSALFDNELSSEQADLVIRRALKDPAMRTSWGRYALIGACMRGEPLAGRSRPESDVAARVRIRLAVEGRGTAAPGELSNDNRSIGGMSTLWRGAMGMGIAAGVAAVSLLLMRTQAPQAGAMVAQVAPQVQAQAQPTVATPVAADSRTLVAHASVPPSYSTPVDTSPAGQRLDAPLVNYVISHSAVSASAVRFSPLSTVMSSSEDFTQDTVEMTPAEIGAHR